MLAFLLGVRWCRVEGSSRNSDFGLAHCSFGLAHLGGLPFPWAGSLKVALCHVGAMARLYGASRNSLGGAVLDPPGVENRSGIGEFANAMIVFANAENLHRTDTQTTFAQLS